MIERYTRPEMGSLFSNFTKFEKMRLVEVAVAEVQAKHKIIPRKAADDIRTKSKFQIDRILEIEQTTKHDVIAFVTNMAENVGDNGKYIHFGLTSSDVLDTALSLQLKEACDLILSGVLSFERELIKLIKTHQKTLCVGRTHGMFAEPTTFGFKLTGFLAELRRNKRRLLAAAKQIAIVKLSGAVGTYSAQSVEIEKQVGKKLDLFPETLATQVIPRDRHAEVLWVLSMLGAGLERLAIEFRHLQRSEVAEVVEGFQPGQKGSSAMPHKKNPISSENVTGLARLLRSYQQASLENIALWHERDISHSSVERVVLPDAFIVCDYALARMTEVLKGIYVNKDQMAENILRSQGQVFSSHVLLLLVEKGLDRDTAYHHVQRLSHGLKPGEQLEDKIVNDPDLKQLVNKREIQTIFSGQKHLKSIQEVIQKAISYE